MIPTGCDDFRDLLARALEEGDAADPETLAALRGHVERCDACRPSADLVLLASLPAEGRDPVPAPAPEVWKRIEAGVARRRRRDDRVRRAVWSLAAAAAAVGIWAGSLSLRPEAPRGNGYDVVPTDPGEFALPFAPGGGDEGVPSGRWSPFPDTEGLDAAERARMIEWLREEEVRLRKEGSA
jgi:AcrR family transcriptional regulator